MSKQQFTAIWLALVAIFGAIGATHHDAALLGVLSGGTMIVSVAFATGIVKP